MPPNLRDQRLLGNWAGGWRSADQEWRRAPLSLLQPKRPAKLAASLKPAGDFFFFLLIILYYYYFIIFLLTPSVSLSFCLALFLLSFPLYLFFLPSSSSSFFLIPTSETIKPGTVRKEQSWTQRGSISTAETVKQISLLTPENLQVIVCLYYFFFIILTSLILLVFLYFSSFCSVFFT